MWKEKDLKGNLSYAFLLLRLTAYCGSREPYFWQGQRIWRWNQRLRLDNVVKRYPMRITMRTWWISMMTKAELCEAEQWGMGQRYTWGRVSQVDSLGTVRSIRRSLYTCGTWSVHMINGTLLPINSGATYNPPIGSCHTVRVVLKPPRAIPTTVGIGPS